MNTLTIPAHLVATDSNGLQVDALGTVDVDIADWLDGRDAATVHTTARLLARRDTDTFAELHRWALDSIDQAAAFARTLADLPNGPQLSCRLQLSPVADATLKALADGRPTDAVRDHMIDAVKRCYGVSKRVAATVVDDAAHDHPSLPDDIDPEEVEDVISVAAGPIAPAEVNVLVRAASNRRLAVTPHRAGPCRIVRADGWTVGAISFSDLSSWQPNRFDGLGDRQPTGMSVGGGTPMKVARHILRLAKMAPQQHCDACGELLEGPDGCFSPSLDRPWCEPCCMSTDVFACETCGKACDVDSGHRNNCGYWCDDCHDPADPDIVCTLHDDACHA